MIYFNALTQKTSPLATCAACLQYPPLLESARFVWSMLHNDILSHGELERLVIRPFSQFFHTDTRPGRWRFVAAQGYRIYDTSREAALFVLEPSSTCIAEEMLWVTSKIIHPKLGMLMGIVASNREAHPNAYGQCWPGTPDSHRSAGECSSLWNWLAHPCFWNFRCFWNSDQCL